MSAYGRLDMAIGIISMSTTQDATRSAAVDIVNCVLGFSQAQRTQMDQINTQQKEQVQASFRELMTLIEASL